MTKILVSMGIYIRLARGGHKWAANEIWCLIPERPGDRVLFCYRSDSQQGVGQASSSPEAVLVSARKIFMGLLKLLNRPFAFFSERSANWEFFKFARALEPVAILAAVVSLIIILDDREEERTTRAWQLVTTKAPGNSGKIEALEFLNQQRFPNWLQWLPFTKEQVSLQGIELIPPILTEEWKETRKEERKLKEPCTQFTNLQKAKLPYGILIDGALICCDLRNADLRRSHLNRADLQGSNMKGVNLWDAELQDALLRRPISGTRILAKRIFGGRTSGRLIFGERIFRKPFFLEPNSGVLSFRMPHL